MRVVVALLVTYAVLAQAAASSIADLVRIDVLPMDARGRVVETLTACVFELIENGVPQTIDRVRLISTSGGASSVEAPQPIQSPSDERREAARDGVRLFAIFLDDYHVSSANALRVRDGVRQLVDTLNTRDLIV